MTTKLTTSIRAGGLDGRAFWDPELQSYAALLSVFEREQAYPPPGIRVGLRPVEHPTVDALASHLHRRGLPIDGLSAGRLQDLRHRVGGAAGRAEVVGLADDWFLFIVTPSRLVLRLQPPVAHPAYRFSWGDNGPATIATARMIGERVLGCSPGHDLDLLALTLTTEYLSSVEGDFSVDAASLCDWYLTDTPLTTALDPLDLLALRHQLDAPHPALLGLGLQVGHGEAA